MRFKCQVDIDLPREKVIELFDSVDNLKHWQDGFISFEHLTGEPGEVGSTARMMYEMNGRPMELIETVTVKNFPDEFSGTYVHKHMTNSMVNKFEWLASDKTRWTAEIEYTQLNGFIIKMMAFLMPGMFKKQTQKWLNQFKAFAEGN
jgi:uncharacterized membrane protein